ncbi:MAG: hypothetical protein HKO96_07435 [Flavobacteriaceae bacterium]|nr:hypothetical protein [Flavobacteriaceae bacterium]
MIKFFRQIRFKLMSSGNTSKYLKYAIGEILLVMIGILLALQVNNWNENRKERNQENAILTQLQAEFKSNLSQLDDKIKSKKESIKSALRLFTYVDYPEMRIKDSVDFYLGRTIPYTTFDPIINDLASSGELRLISNNSLKRKLSRWTSEIADLREDELQWKDYRDNKYVPFLIEYYQLRTVRKLANESNVLGKYLIEDDPTTVMNSEIGESVHQHDFNDLLNHPDFEDHLERCLTKNRHSLNQSLILRKRVVELLNTLNAEIDQ